MNCISCSTVRKLFFAPNSPIFQKCWQKKKKLAFSKRFTLKANAVTKEITKSRWRIRCLQSKSTNCIRKIKITRPCDQRFIWLYGRKLLIVCNNPARFGGHMYRGSGDNIFSSGDKIYQVTSNNHVIKGLHDLISRCFL